MDLNIPTLAQRKAARRSQPSTGETSSIQVTSTVEAPLEEQKVSSSQSLPVEPKVTPQKAPNSSSQMDKEHLIALARSMGLEIASPKKIWIKHSYSVTPESKNTFSKYCDVLGIKMQDGLEEAFQDWFKKKDSEYKAIQDAKSS